MNAQLAVGVDVALLVNAGVERVRIFRGLSLPIQERNGGVSDS
jgi:hypothetical protein